MKSHLKRFLITGYCWGVIPASVVTVLFKWFRLRAE